MWNRLIQGMGLCVVMAGLAGCTPSGPRQCEVVVSGVLPIISNKGSPIVRAGINGHPVALEIDTGAMTTIIGSSYIERLQLQTLGSPILIRGVGGDTFGRAALIENLEMGPSRARNITILAGGKFEKTIGGLPIVGLFGRDFLSNYDTIIDIPNHVVKLVEVRHCLSPTPGWNGRVHEVRVTRQISDGMETRPEVRVNGHNVDAILDSGATGTLMTTSMARRAGVTRDMLEKDPQETGYGLTREAVKTYSHLFSSLEVGDMTFRNVTLGVTDELPDMDMLLGSDFLRHHRVWIARENKIYIQKDSDISGPESNAESAY